MYGALQRFWRAPILNQLQMLTTFFYRLKGLVFYRFVFKEFGKSSYIRKPLLILNSNFIRIGSRVSIREGVRLEVVRSNERRVPCLSIGNDTNIEQNVHIVCHSRVRIGNSVSVTGHCCIVDVTHPYFDVEGSAKIGTRIVEEDSFVEVGDGSFVGFGVVILPNVRIGIHSVIGANSVVTSDIPDYSVAAGAPAKILKRYDPEERRWVSVDHVPVQTENS